MMHPQAVCVYGSNLRYADPVLQADREVVIAALTGLHPTDPRHRAIQDNPGGHIIGDLFHSQRLDCQLTGRHHALEYASKSLCADRDVVQLAVSIDGYSLKSASMALKNDRQIASTAIRGNSLAFQYAGTQLKSDPDFALEAVARSGFNLQYVSDELKNMKDIVIAAVKDRADSIEYAGEKARDDREVVMAAVSRSGTLLAYAGENMKKDLDVVIQAVRKAPSAIKMADKSLRNHPHVLLRSKWKERRPHLSSLAHQFLICLSLHPKIPHMPLEVRKRMVHTFYLVSAYATIDL